MAPRSRLAPLVLVALVTTGCSVTPERADEVRPSSGAAGPSTDVDGERPATDSSETTSGQDATSGDPTSPAEDRDQDPAVADPRRPLAPGLTGCPPEGDGPPAAGGMALADGARPAVPYVPACSAADLAAAITAAETDARDPELSAAERGEAGFRSQLAHRQLAARDDWRAEALDALPADVRATTELMLRARGSLDDLAADHERPARLPAWELVPPADPDDLLVHYSEAGEAEGVPWEVLAAINLVETRMGRIRGLSSAGARGPMQFIPASWDIFGADGDVDDERDSIRAAARHLATRPGLTGPDFDRDRALFAYNNSQDYVRAVGAYADLLTLAPEAYHGLWGWQVFFAAEGVTAWLPVGWRSEQGEDASVYARRDEVIGTAPELAAP